MKKYKDGFAILEGCVVIIVLSIIISCIVSLKYTFKQTRNIKLLAQIQEILNASTSFKEQYGGIAGDMTNTQNAGISVINLDGNGNDIIDINDEINEDILFWRQLYSTGLLKRKNGENNPSSVIDSNVFYTVFSHEGKNYLHLGKLMQDNKLIFSDKILTPLEAFYIDDKIDIGTPDEGDVLAVNGSDINDFFNTRPSTDCVMEHTYNIKHQGKSCQLIIELK